MKALNVKRVLLLCLMILAGCGGGGPATGPLNPPSDVKAEGRSGEIVLTWKDNSTEEEGFRIFRKSEADEAFPELPLNEVGADVTTYTDTAVSSAESYVYQVQAYSSTDAGEFSAASNTAKATQGAGKVRLTVIRTGSAVGTTTSEPAGIYCINPSSGICSLEVDPSTTVTLTANPDETGNPPSIFAGFSGACTTTSLTCEVVVDANKDVSATFNEARPGITVQLAGPTGSGRVVDFTGPDVGGPYINCTGGDSDCTEADYFNIGNTVVLYAEPVDGNSFVGWEGCDRVANTTRNGTEVPNGRCDFTVDATNVITATFAEIPDAPVVAFRPLNTGTEDLTYRVGARLRLEWTIENEPVTSLTFNGADLDVDDRSADITLPSTGGANAYRLEARNGNPDPGVDTLSITTGEVPQIGEPAEQPRPSDPPVQPNNPDGSYTLTWTPDPRAPGAISRGDPANYTYTLTPVEPAGATRAVTLAPGAAAGSYVLTLAAGTTPGRYRLEASNEFGTSANAAGTGSDEFTIAAATQTPNPTITDFTAPDTTFATGGEARLEWGFAPDGATPTDLTLLQGDTPAASECQPATRTSTSTTCAVTADTAFRLQVQPGGNTAGPITISVGTAPVTVPATPPVVTGIVPGAYTFNWTQSGTGPVRYVLTGPTGSSAVIPPIPDDATTVDITGAVTGEVYTLIATNDYGLTTPTATDPAPVTFTIP